MEVEDESELSKCVIHFERLENDPAAAAIRRIKAKLKRKVERMAGTKAGALKAVKTSIERHGKDFYARIGHIGGSKSSDGGFASEKVGNDGLTGRERAHIAGKKGGSISRRNKKKIVKGNR